MNARALKTFAAAVFTLISATAHANPTRVVKTFDGQIMSCESREDIGRAAYRITSQQGVIKAGNVEVTIEFETLKCAEHAGNFAFEKASLNSRIVSRSKGFVEFSTLELVGYTPDFKVVKAQQVRLNAPEHRVTFVAPVDGFVGLLPRNAERNANGSGGRRATMMAFLRGYANLGDARTGKVLEQTLIPFGAYGIFLSEEKNTLAFASQISGSLDPQMLP